MKRFLKIASALIAIFVLAVIALFVLVDANQFRPLLEAQLTQALQRSVHLGDIQLSLLSGGASSSELTISDDPAFGAQPFLKSGLLEIGVDIPVLIFSRALHVRALTIDDAEVMLIRKADGSWNFSSLGVPQQPTAAVPVPAPEPAPVQAAVAAPTNASTELSINLIRVDKARVHLLDGATKHDLQNVNFELRDFSPRSKMPFSLDAEVLGGGKFDLKGTAGPLAMNVAETPFLTEIKIEDLDFGSGAPDGLLQVQGKASSDGTKASVTAALVIDRLKLSKAGTPATQPLTLNLVLAHDLKTRQGTLSGSTVKLGSAAANLDGNYDFGNDATAMDLSVEGSSMPLEELAVFLPAMDVQLPAGSSLKGGTISANISARGRGNVSTSKGMVKIENTRLEHFSLGSQLGVLRQFVNLPASASTDIALASADFENGGTGTRLRNIRLAVPELGELTGEGTVSPAHELNLRMKAAIRNVNLPFVVRGTSSSPSFQADLGRITKAQVQEAIRDPEGAAKKGNSIVNKAKGLLDFFKRGSKKDNEKK